MDCCQCQGIKTQFDAQYVAKKLKKYREKGLRDTTRMLIDALKAQDIRGMTLLDIGGGIGAIAHELIEAGVSSSVNVEASAAYAEACKEEAERVGHAEKVHVYQGNFVDLAQDVPASDIVTLDRVICCYHDMPELVGKSLAKARTFYGLVYPRDKLWVKFLMSIYYNLRFWFQRDTFRVFVHPTQAVEALIQTAGLKRIFFKESGAWQIALYARSI